MREGEKRESVCVCMCLILCVCVWTCVCAEAERREKEAVEERENPLWPQDKHVRPKETSNGEAAAATTDQETSQATAERSAAGHQVHARGEWEGEQRKAVASAENECRPWFSRSAVTLPHVYAFVCVRACVCVCVCVCVCRPLPVFVLVRALPCPSPLSCCRSFLSLSLCLSLSLLPPSSLLHFPLPLLYFPLLPAESPGGRGRGRRRLRRSGGGAAAAHTPCLAGATARCSTTASSSWRARRDGARAFRRV